MLQLCLPIPSHRRDHLQIQRLLSMFPSSTGFRASVLCSDSTWLISSIRTGLEATKGLEVQERCGGHGYSFLWDWHSWQEAFPAVWYGRSIKSFFNLSDWTYFLAHWQTWLWSTSWTTTAQFTYYDYANVSQSVALMLSEVVLLWIAHNTCSEYEYNLTLWCPETLSVLLFGTTTLFLTSFCTSSDIFIFLTADCFKLKVSHFHMYSK